MVVRTLRWLGLALGLTLTLTATSAKAATLQEADVVWKPPPPDQVEAIGAFWPKSDKPAYGRLELECVITPEGLLSDCAVVADGSVNADLKPFALKLTSVMAVEPRTIAGASVAGQTLHFAIAFPAPEGD